MARPPSPPPLRHDLRAELVPVAALVPWDRNPRINDAASKRLARTIEAHGWTTPLLVQRSSSRVVAGHTRLKAAAILGLTEVPVVWLDVDDRRATEIALADNRLAELAEWEDDGLAALLLELADDGADLALLGWTDDELDGLLGVEPVPAPSDDAPPLPEEPVSVPGEVYELGPHRLVCGDCRDAGTVAKLLGGQKINVAFTSPPYASQRKYDEDSGFKPIPPDEYVDWFEAVQANVREHLAEDGSWFVNIKAHSEGGQRHLYVVDLALAHARRWAWRFVDEFCWRNTANGVPGTWPDRFKNAWEPLFHFAAGPPKFRPGNVKHSTEGAFSYGEREESRTGTPFIRGGAVKCGDALPSNVIEARPCMGGLHPAPFPILLPDFFIRAFSDEGDAIFDPFMGGGTTLIAAAQNGRRAFGSEISASYCDVIRRRWTMWADAAGVDAGPGRL